MSIENKIVSTIGIETRQEENTFQTKLPDEKMNSILQEQEQRPQKQEESVSEETPPPLESPSLTTPIAAPSIKMESTEENVVGELSTDTAQSASSRPVWLCLEWPRFEKSWAVDPTFMNPDWLKLEEMSSDWFTEEEMITFPESQTGAEEENEEEITETERLLSLESQTSPEQQKIEKEESNKKESLDFDQNEEALLGKENSADKTEASLFEEASSLDQGFSKKNASLKEENSFHLQEKPSVEKKNEAEDEPALEKETSIEKENGEEKEPALSEEPSVEKKNGEKGISFPAKGEEEETPSKEENPEKMEKFQDWESGWGEEWEKNDDDPDSKWVWESTRVQKKEVEEGKKWDPTQPIDWFYKSTVGEEERRLEEEEELERQELEKLWSEAYARQRHDHEEDREQIEESAFALASPHAGSIKDNASFSTDKENTPLPLVEEKTSLSFTKSNREKETSCFADERETSLLLTDEETSLSLEEQGTFLSPGEEDTSLSPEKENTTFSPTEEETSLSVGEEEIYSSAEEGRPSSFAGEKEPSSFAKEEDTSSSPGEKNSSLSIKLKERKNEEYEGVQKEWESVWKRPWEEAVKRDWNYEEDGAVDKEPVEEKTRKESQEMSPELDRNERARRLWLRCEECGSILYRKHVKENNKVCFTCASHLDMSSEERIENLIDANSWKPINDQVSPGDPLEFEDEKRYLNRLEESQERTGLQDAIQTGTAMIEGIPIALGVMDFQFMGGSMGSVVGEKITRLIEYALEEGLFLVLVCASGGARMQEGIFSLMQMAKISGALSLYKSCGNLLYISLLTSPTTGGVTASFAMLGDIIIAEPKAVIGFAGRRVIEQTLQEELPENFQTAEYLHFHGLIDLIVHRRHLREAFFECISFHQNASLKVGNMIMIKSYYSGNRISPSNSDNGVFPPNRRDSNPSLNGFTTNEISPPHKKLPFSSKASLTSFLDGDSTPAGNEPVRSEFSSFDGDSTPDSNEPAPSETPSPDEDLSPYPNGNLSLNESSTFTEEGKKI
uniref:Acetyl-coenzyme A carboxylase carboxyl transferase subunit beta, chloroplastic n=1 Tax=Elliptochloris bilobata TaxID=381761 RepID=A0A097KQU9_9CHLO|nr:beta subunit of acetyl-CoA carboxylase carboxytransferase [Elliptochloris bilobata]AIT95556.1 beta subunit of acetyl-CoA carboxylase carboxytransferase [Elliptochloris bilobata]